MYYHGSYFYPMKNLSAYLSLAALLLLGSAGCSKSKDAMPAPAPYVAPQEYLVEYRVSSPDAPAADYVAYNDAKNGSVQLATTPLPFSYSFKRVMSKADYMTLSATVPAGPNGTTTTLITSILLNGKEVKRTQVTANAPQAITVYVIGG